MKNDRLFIDNQLVDIGENVNITLVINSNLFRDITKMTGNTTYTIRLPRTSHNAAVFGMAGDVRSDETFPTVYHKADFLRDGVPVITGGRAVLLSVSDMYEISISWGAFAPLANVINDGLTLNQLSGNETIYWGWQNAATKYEDAMADGYYYADYNPYFYEPTTDWVGNDSVWYRQADIQCTFENGAVLTAAIGQTMSLAPVTRAGSQYVIVPFTVGMACLYNNITGTADARAWCIVDKASKVILVSEDLTTSTGDFYAPVNAAYLIINSTTAGTAEIIYGGVNPVKQGSFMTYLNRVTRLPVVNVSWILQRIKVDTGVEFVFPLYAQQLINSLAIPLVTAKANALTMGGVTQMDFVNTHSLGALGIVATANTIFTEQTGTVNQLTATRSAKVVIDCQGLFLWDFTTATPQGTGVQYYDGNPVTVRHYTYAPTYIEIRVAHTNPEEEDSIYIVGTQNVDGMVMQNDYESDNGTDFTRMIYGYGEIEIMAGDVVTMTLKNRRGTLNGFWFLQGRAIFTESVEGDVPRGAQYPIIENLPEIKITDFIQFLCAVTACVPINLQQTGKVLFAEIEQLFSSALYDWTTKIIPANDDAEQAQEITYRLNEYARKNWYRWKEDDRVIGNYDGYMEIHDDTLEAEHDVITFPFAASDGDRVPIFTGENRGSFGGSDNGVEDEITLKPCEPRIMTVYKASSGVAALRFDIDMQEVINTQMTGMAASLADVRVIKERVRMSDVELAAFNESVPVYLRQYGSYFAVLTLESSGDGTAIATMLRLRKSSSEPVPPPGPVLPYDAEIEYLESTGTQWIDTGVIPQFPDSLTYIARVSYPNTTTRQIMGRQGSFYFGVVNGKFQSGQGGTTTTNVVVSANVFHDIECNITSTTPSHNGTYAYNVDGTSGSITITFQNQPTDGTIWIFCANDANTLRGSNKISSFVIKRNGVTLRDFIPVRVGQVGMLYDRVSEQLYGNAGTGDFVLGADKN